MEESQRMKAEQRSKEMETSPEETEDVEAELELANATPETFTGPSSANSCEVAEDSREIKSAMSPRKDKEGGICCVKCPFSSMPGPASRGTTAMRHAAKCTGIRPFVCSGCDKSFAQKPPANTHARSCTTWAKVTVPNR